eukprot:SAG22_NODE_4673_length_1198_cov_1.538672_2_plen_251_part_00
MPRACGLGLSLTHARTHTQRLAAQIAEHEAEMAAMAAANVTAVLKTKAVGPPPVPAAAVAAAAAADGARELLATRAEAPVEPPTPVLPAAPELALAAAVSRRQAYSELFDRFDTDGTGTLDEREGKAYLHISAEGKMDAAELAYFWTDLLAQTGCGGGGGGGGSAAAAAAQEIPKAAFLEYMMKDQLDADEQEQQPLHHHPGQQPPKAAAAAGADAATADAPPARVGSSAKWGARDDESDSDSDGSDALD